MDFFQGHPNVLKILNVRVAKKLLFAMCEIKTDCRIFHVKSEGRVNREMVKKVKKSYINKVYLFFLHYFCTPKHINDNSYAK